MRVNHPEDFESALKRPAADGPSRVPSDVGRADGSFCSSFWSLEFALLEAGLRVYGSSEGTTTFQSLFMPDPHVGVRLRPGARIRYTTVEFTHGHRDQRAGRARRSSRSGPKAPDERRVLVLGDSLVLSVQVPLAQTFCKDLERG